MKWIVKHGRGSMEQFTEQYETILNEGYKLAEKEILVTNAGLMWYFVFKGEEVKVEKPKGDKTNEKDI